MTTTMNPSQHVAMVRSVEFNCYARLDRLVAEGVLSSGDAFAVRAEITEAAMTIEAYHKEQADDRAVRFTVTRAGLAGKPYGVDFQADLLDASIRAGLR